MREREESTGHCEFRVLGPERASQGLAMHCDSNISKRRPGQDKTSPGGRAQDLEQEGDSRDYKKDREGKLSEQGDQEGEDTPPPVSRGSWAALRCVEGGSNTIPRPTQAD